VQKYGRARGWPTEENRDRFYESRYDREERESRDDAQRASGGPTSSGAAPVRPDRARLADERRWLLATLRGFVAPGGDHGSW
jgi:hypothetical protein